MMDDPGSKFKLIHQLSCEPNHNFKITELCQLNGVSRSGYYSWLKAENTRLKREEKDREDFELILKAYKTYGYSKGARGIHMAMLHFEPPVHMNLKKIRRLMNKFNLECPIRKANPYRRMAKAIKTNNVAKNVVQREFEEHGPRKILLTDITYIPYKGTFAYLSTILDAYTKQILAYKLSPNLQVDFVLETVNELVKRHGVSLGSETIIHSDQGCHYTSLKFIDLVTNQKLRRSMSRKGNCWDNACQESFFGHMKDEIKDKISSCSTFDDVKAVIDEWMDYYNNNRYQWQLAKLSPNEFYEYITTGVYPIHRETPALIKLGRKNRDQE